MITKAGMPSSKVVVGVTSYGRSFEMTMAGCYTETCTFTGPLSGATPGKCTGTAGYIAQSEFFLIIAAGGNILSFLDASLSNILVYHDNQWISYIDDSNKAFRTSLYQAYNMGGTSDWAVDLGASLSSFPKVCIAGTGPGNYADLCAFTCALGFCPSPCTCTAEGSQAALPTATGGLGYPLPGADDSYIALCEFACNLGHCPSTACSSTPASGSYGGVIYLPPSIWSTGGPANIGCNQDCTFIFPPSSLPAPETITWPSLTTSLLSLSGGNIYTKATVLSVPVFTITQITYWSVTIAAGDPIVGTFTPVQSIMPLGFTLELPGTEATFPPSHAPSYSNYQPVAASSSSALPIPFFFPTSYGVTIQPQPTISINTPTSSGSTTHTPLIVVYSSTSGTPPQQTCTSGCGSHNCGLLGCGGGCGFFGCGGGCGLFGCGGGCGILGCGKGCHDLFGCGSGSCPLTNPLCTNLGCLTGCPGRGIGEGDGEPKNEQPTSCTTSTTVSICAVQCTYTNYGGSVTATGCGMTTCAKTITGCDVAGKITTSATTTSISCPIRPTRLGIQIPTS